MPSLFIPTIPEAYKKLRYKVKYLIVDTKSKWYSTSRNPRLVQSKFQGQTFITLRVHPHDKYVIKPGEFLSVGRKRVNSFSMNSFVDLYCQEVVENMSFSEYKESEDLVDLNENLFAETKDTSDNKIQMVDLAQTPISPLTRASNFFRGISKNEPTEPELNDKKFLESPGIRAWKRKHMYRLMRRLGWPEQEIVEVERELIGVEKAVVPEMPPAKVWTRVLNDVSLSAAQISTGSVPSSRGDYENLSSDLTEGKRKAGVQPKN